MNEVMQCHHGFEPGAATFRQHFRIMIEGGIIERGRRRFAILKRGLHPAPFNAEAEGV